MLPNVVPSKLVRAALVGATTLSLIAALAAPAQAFGRNERKFVQGMAAAAIIGTIYHNMQTRQPQYAYPPRPVYQPAPVYRPAPVYVAPPPVYAPAPQVYYRPAAPVYQPSIYTSPVAVAFNSYGSYERQRIQQRLSSYGYYRSGIDGAFGPGTYNAVVAYANGTGQSRSLGSTAGVYGLFDGLIY